MSRACEGDAGTGETEGGRKREKEWMSRREKREGEEEKE